MAADPPPRIRHVLDALRAVLVPGECLELWALQHRLCALHHRRHLIALTSGRLLIVHRLPPGGFDLTDLRWQDLEHVHLQVGVIAATLTVRAAPRADLALRTAEGPHRLLTLQGLLIEQAQACYRFMQAASQAWREKRRIRELEELQARSGTFLLGRPAGTVNPTPAAAAASDTLTRLTQLRELHEKRFITDSEYESIKARIVSF